MHKIYQKQKKYLILLHYGHQHVSVTQVAILMVFFEEKNKL
jgi:hypothetical protein